MAFFLVTTLVASAVILGGLGIVMIVEGLCRRFEREQSPLLWSGEWVAPRQTLLSVGETARLRSALEQNADDGASLMMDHRTTFTGVALEEEEATQTINRIKSIPMHY